MEEEKLYEPLGERMKKYEKLTDYCIEPTAPFIVRLDGNSFSKFTKPLNKPFDHSFVCAMVSTMNDMITNFSARTGYCHSDEITLIFPAAASIEDFQKDPKKYLHIYNGRIQKICSVFASYCSVRFNHYLKLLITQDKYSEEVVKKITSDTAIFDARIVLIQSVDEIINHMIWRSCYDCHRNAVSTYAQHYFSHKQLDNKTTDDKIEMLKTVGIIWDEIPIHLKHGVYAKKELYEKECEINGEKMKITRTTIINKCFKISFTKEYGELLINKVWPENDNNYLNFE